MQGLHGMALHQECDHLWVLSYHRPWWRLFRKTYDYLCVYCMRFMHELREEENNANRNAKR